MSHVFERYIVHHQNRSSALSGVRSGVTMPSAFAMSEGTLLGLQSSVGVAIENSLDVQRKEEALVCLQQPQRAPDLLQICKSPGSQ